MGQKLFLLFACVFSGLVANAQQQSKLDLALRYVEQNASTWNLKESDYKDMVVSHFAQDDRIGATYVYFNQAKDGIQVKNAVLNLTIDKNGKVVFAACTFVPDFLSKVVAGRSNIKAEDAVVSAAKHLGIVNAVKPQATKRSDNGKITFEAVPYSDTPITAELKYDVQNEKIVPVWEITMDMASNADYWEIRMSALDRSFVSKNNLTVYCQHKHGKYTKHNDCGAYTASIQNENAKPLDAAIAASSYRVYALPAESPIHGNHVLLTDPAYPESSPFGWHDTNGVDGPEFTTTQGNNVYAYTDKDDDDSPDADVPQPDGGLSLIFDFPHDVTKDPIESPNATQTNLFYMNNMMHDITALYGFDEQSGNFQSKNYSNKGAGNDFVLAQAYDGFELSPQKLDNANFSTPPDGANGRMQMFLWTVPSGSVSIDAPDDIKGFIADFGTADFGLAIPTATQPAITGNLAVALSNDISNPTTCCKPVITDLTGKIALVDRGSCDFSKKVFNAQQKGAVAVIICNIVGVNGGIGEEISNMTGAANAAEVTIPSIFMKKSDCDRIRVKLSAGTDVTMTLQQRIVTGPKFLDGAFDNGIMAHEYGHGISNRLTGGPANASCLTNAEQMGEGWSDFFSLIMTVEPGDQGTDARGIGNYAIASQINGPGIRRYPYSTDLNVNPQSFDDIKNQSVASTPYAVGEVWVDCLWEVYWLMVDKYGYDSNWRNFNSGNAKTLSLVMQAMKIQGCNPGLIRGRNAIIEADSLLNGGTNTFLIWDAFAKRGLGYFADGGSENDANDGTENFDPHPLSVEQLKITKTATESINAGEDINITIKAVNHVPSLQTGVVIIDDLPQGASFLSGSSSMPGTVVGNTIRFEVGDMAYKEELTITYKLQTSSGNISPELVNYGFEDFEEWEVETNAGTSIWTISDLDKHSGEVSYYVPAEAVDNDHSLITPVLNVSGELPVLRFWHKFDTQVGVDGGFIQIASDPNFTDWLTVEDGFLRNGYNNVIAYTTFALPSLQGFTGSTNSQFIDSYLDLSAYKGKNIKVRFRFGSNEEITLSGILAGWFVDDVAILDLYKYDGKACITNGDNSKGTCTLPTRTVVNSQTTAVSDAFENDFGMAVSPNPAHDVITVSAISKANGEARVSMQALDGKQLFSTKVDLRKDQASFLSINTSGLSAGMYIVTLQSGSQHVSKRIIIN